MEMIQNPYVGQAFYYTSGEYENRVLLPPPSNFNPHSDTDPAAEPYIWRLSGKWEFIYDDRQWKLFIPRI